NVKFENFQYIDEERIHRYEIITPDRRDGLIRRFEQMGAHLVVLDEQQLHSCRIKRERSVNSINWRLRNAGGNLPTMFFTYEGDFENVRRVFDQIAGQPGVKALFSSRR
ncbi:MAG: hypothetical protein KKA42_01320, partial [candidate division Zixibacteria bacterium]|nr:hypothetical protein [candidate division Zixibacteria bacterium]